MIKENLYKLNKLKAHIKSLENNNILKEIKKQERILKKLSHSVKSPGISTRLNKKDYADFLKICNKRKLTKSEYLRKLIKKDLRK